MKDLSGLAELIRIRNAVAAGITRIIDRPCQLGHLGEYIASEIFDIELAESATTEAIDGHFRSGLLQGRSVNIKWYGKAERMLDITPPLPDFYLVLTGPHGSLTSSRGVVRPWLIEHVYLFEANVLIADLTTRGTKIGVATSVIKERWESAEIYPKATNSHLSISDEQREALALFSGKRT